MWYYGTYYRRLFAAHGDFFSLTRSARSFFVKMCSPNRFELETPALYEDYRLKDMQWSPLIRITLNRKSDSINLMLSLNNGLCVLYGSGNN